MIVIEDDKIIVHENGRNAAQFGIGTPEAFRLLSQLWIRSGWDTKYVYSFTWLGRPVIQLPEDMIRLQELIFAVQPDLIVETGVAHGGSLCFYASICKALGKGRVLGVEIELRPHSRSAIESHCLAPWISLIEGNSTDLRVVSEVRANIPHGGRVLVLLDSCHTRDHVRAELEAYSAMIAPGSYIVAMDGVMEQLAGAPRTQPDWRWNNPRQAAREFAAAHPEFAIVEPPFLFNEGQITERVTYWPGAFLRRRQVAPD
jgi:cephalosporin hydroxylase